MVVVICEELTPAHCPGLCHDLCLLARQLPSLYLSVIGSLHRILRPALALTIVGDIPKGTSEPWPIGVNGITHQVGECWALGVGGWSGMYTGCLANRGW